MRQRPTYTATMDAKLLAKLDLAKGPVPRSEFVEAAIKFGLEFFEDMKRMVERYDRAAKVRERGGPK
jgi:hypothetical protein